MRNLFKDKRVWLVGAVLVTIFLIIGSKSPKPQLDTKVSNNQSSAITDFTQVGKIGEEAFIRSNGTSTITTDIVFLATTQEGYSQLTKSIMANDTQGIMDNKTVFGVSSGAKVLIIDSAFGIRKVRIISGLRSVDTDKVGMTGWVAKEFVVNK